MSLPSAGTYCHRQQTPSHRCSREFLSLAACVKYKVIPNIQGQGPPQGQGQGFNASTSKTNIAQIS